MNSTISNFPDISFIDDTTVDQVIDQMISDFQDKYAEVTGENVTLAQADPYRMIIYACAYQIYQTMQYADRAGKQSFLKYAYGDFLDNLGALRGITRLAAKAAVTTLKFEISTALSSAVSIPAGTRVTNGNGVYFFTDEYAEIPVGELYVTVGATCTETGEGGNGFRQNEINILVDLIPYITSSYNTTETAGGSSIESDDALADRIYLSSSAYSVAGPVDAYVYHTKSVNANIEDVNVTSPDPCEVDVRFILKNGELPSQSLIDEVEAKLTDANIRPLTDQVTVGAPTQVSYNIELTYYINESDKSAAATIQSLVTTAIETYKTWQCSKIGRDINPSYLSSKIIEAGAKRVDIVSPSYTVLEDDNIAKIGSTTANYGGIESD